MDKVYTSKGELIKDIILESEKPLTYREVYEIFKEKAQKEVTIPRIRQVAEQMEVDDLVRIDKEVDESGNAVNVIKKEE